MNKKEYLLQIFDRIIEKYDNNEKDNYACCGFTGDYGSSQIDCSCF